MSDFDDASEIICAQNDAIEELESRLATVTEELKNALRENLELASQADRDLVRDQEYQRLHREKMEDYHKRIEVEALLAKVTEERDIANAALALCGYGADTHGMMLGAMQTAVNLTKEQRARAEKAEDALKLVRQVLIASLDYDDGYNSFKNAIALIDIVLMRSP